MKNEELAHNKGYKIIAKNIIRSPKGNILKLRKDTSGYLEFRIRALNPKQRKLRHVPVHRFVAYEKYGKNLYKEGMVVRHKNGNKIDNSYDNILIGTVLENMMDIPKKERIRRAIKASSKKRKLSDNEVKDIINLRKSGYTYKQIKEKYSIAKSTLSYLFNKANYNVNI